MTREDLITGCENTAQKDAENRLVKIGYPTLLLEKKCERVSPRPIGLDLETRVSRVLIEILTRVISGGVTHATRRPATVARLKQLTEQEHGEH